jgi:CheY-like chemotaxis protein
MELLAPSYREHVMLLCENRSDCDAAAIEAINEGLKSGQLCVYASVLNGNPDHLSEILSKIHRSGEHIENGDLIVIDFRPFADYALESNLAPFNELKEGIEAMVRGRIEQGKSDRALIFAEAAGELAGNQEFGKSVDLEMWWNDVHADWLVRKLNITIICPHPSPILTGDSISRSNLAYAHTLTLDLAELQKRQQALQDLRILVVEPEPDIRHIYQKYFEKLGSIKATTVGGGMEALELVKSQAADGFDLIILDSHLKDTAAIEVARRIISLIPYQRIAFTTTASIAMIKADIRSIRLNSEEILVKPFSFSRLLELVGSKIRPVDRQVS